MSLAGYEPYEPLFGSWEPPEDDPREIDPIDPAPTAPMHADRNMDDMDSYGRPWPPDSFYYFPPVMAAKLRLKRQRREEEERLNDLRWAKMQREEQENQEKERLSLQDRGIGDMLQAELVRREIKKREDAARVERIREALTLRRKRKEIEDATEEVEEEEVETGRVGRIRAALRLRRKAREDAMEEEEEEVEQDEKASNPNNTPLIRPSYRPPCFNLDRAFVAFRFVFFIAFFFCDVK